MDIVSVIGILATIGFTVYGILISGDISSFIDIPSVIIVFGGVLGTMLLSSRKNNVKQILSITILAFRERTPDKIKVIDEFVELSVKARRNGLLSLEDELQEIKDSFVRKGLMMIVDGVEPESIKRVLGLKLNGLAERHKQNRGLFDTGATLAPAFGMLGTLIGLINMLKTLDDPSTIGPQMSVALVTTFYGSLIANVICIPLSKKLKAKTEEEIYQKQMVIEGLLSIQEGENPNILKEKMFAYLNDKELRRYEKMNTTVEGKSVK